MRENISPSQSLRVTEALRVTSVHITFVPTHSLEGVRAAGVLYLMGASGQ
jgi:hypothetical protein